MNGSADRPGAPRHSTGTEASHDRIWLIDSHVHYYDCFRWPAFLQGALANFAAGARELGRDPERVERVLCFAEDVRHHVFDRLRDGEAAELASIGWRFEPTGETESFRLLWRDAPDSSLLCLRGRQIVTCEGLEVLALATAHDFADGAPLDQTVDGVRARDAVAVIPWGFGKWWFGRGRVLRAYLESGPREGVFLGDNSGRARGLPQPRPFRVGSAQGVPILPGTDPLAFASETATVGRYGFELPAAVDGRRPAAGLRRALEGTTRSPRSYGRRASFRDFARNQVSIQVRTRVGGAR